jgi:cell division protein FtsA
MEANEMIVGLDVGSNKTCAAVGYIDDNQQLNIMGFGMVVDNFPVEKGMIRHITQASDTIKKVLDQAGDRSDLLIGSVIANISTPQIKCTEQRGSIMLNAKDREIQYNDLEQLFNQMKLTGSQAGYKLLHNIAQEFEVDNNVGGQQYDPVGMPGLKLESNFINIAAPDMAITCLNKAMPQIVIKNRKEKVEITELLYSPLASAMATLIDDEINTGVCLVDIGADTTDIAIFHKNILRYTAVLPIGGKQITNDIQMAFGVLENIAEQLKQKFGLALSAKVPDNEFVEVPGIGDRGNKQVAIKNLSVVVEARLKEIAALVLYHVNKAGFDNKLPAGLVITGGVAKTENLKELFEKITPFYVKIGRPELNIANKGQFAEVFDPAYATAIGLLWKGYKSYDKRKTAIIADKKKVKSTENTKQSWGLFDAPIARNIKKIFKGGNPEDMNDRLDN